MPRETTVSKGGVRSDLICPYISMKARLKVKAKLFVLCFAFDDGVVLLTGLVNWHNGKCLTSLRDYPVLL